MAPADRMASAVMLNCGAAAGVVVAEGEEPLAVAVHRAPAARQVLFDHVERERVVSRRHRRVRREHGRAPHLRERVLPRYGPTRAVAHAAAG